MSIRGIFRTAGWLMTLGGIGLSGVGAVNGFTMGATAPEALRTNINTTNMDETVRLVKNPDQQKSLHDTFAAVTKNETITAEQAKALMAHSFNVGTAVSSASALTGLTGVGLLAVTRRRKKPAAGSSS